MGFIGAITPEIYETPVKLLKRDQECYEKQ
jgi:hypothetical protein